MTIKLAKIWKDMKSIILRTRVTDKPGELYPFLMHYWIHYSINEIIIHFINALMKLKNE